MLNEVFFQRVQNMLNKNICVSEVVFFGEDVLLFMFSIVRRLCCI